MGKPRHRLVDRPCGFDLGPDLIDEVFAQLARLVRGELFLRQLVGDMADLCEIEDGLDPMRGDDDAVGRLGGVAHAELVIDVGVGDRDVGDD